MVAAPTTGASGRGVLAAAAREGARDTRRDPYAPSLEKTST